MSMAEYAYDDGGRAAAGYRGRTGDCVTRAIAIATELPYGQVYDELYEQQRAWLAKSRSKRLSARGKNPSPRTGVFREVYQPYLFDHGWLWAPTMKIGSGTTVHLRADELPRGRIIARCSRHVVAVVDGVVHDTADPRRDGTRAVYGYFERGGGE